MKRIFPLFFIIALFTFSGCHQESEQAQILDEAEAIIETNYDSALILLQEIDTTAFAGNKERAKYGLLLAMAEDKNHLIISNFNLLNFANEFYNTHKDENNLIKSIYYTGRYYYQKKDYTNSLMYFFKAKDLADGKEKQYFWNGMANRGISDIYTKTSNYADELFFSKKEYENIKKSGKQPFLNYAILDYATALNNSGRHKEVIDLATEVLDSAQYYQDEYLKYSALRLKAYNVFWEFEDSSSLKLFEELIENPNATTEDSLNYIWNLILVNEVENAKKLLENVSEIEKPIKTYLKFLIYKKNNNYPEAIQEIEKYVSLTDKQDNNKRNIDLAASINNYYEIQKELTNEKIKAQKFKIGFILSLSILTFIIISYVIAKLIKNHKRILNQKFQLIEELSSTLKRFENNEIKSKGLLEDLLKSQLTIISDIVEIQRYTPQDKLAKKKIGEKIMHFITINSIDGENLPVLEGKINEIYDNMFSDFRRDLPNLKKEDYALFLYSILGFSNAVITELLRENKIESIYNRRRRLKDKINSLPDSKSKIYLQYL